LSGDHPFLPILGDLFDASPPLKLTCFWCVLVIWVTFLMPCRGGSPKNMPSAADKEFRCLLELKKSVPIAKGLFDTVSIVGGAISIVAHIAA